MKEARIEGKGIQLNGWFRWTLGVLVTLLLTGGTWTVGDIQNKVSQNAHDNRQQNKDITEIKVSIAKFTSIQSDIKSLNRDMGELKSILRRTIPYERKGNFNQWQNTP